MSGGPVDLGHVGDLWSLQAEERQDILDFRGALATGMALDAAGERRLGERFIAWVHRSSPGGFAELFPNELNRFGDLDATETSETESLEELLAAFERIAVGR